MNKESFKPVIRVVKKALEAYMQPKEEVFMKGKNEVQSHFEKTVKERSNQL